MKLLQQPRVFTRSQVDCTDRINLGDSEGFRSLKEDEEVEFTISDNGGKSKAVDVTGVGGGYVQGAPRRTKGDPPPPSPFPPSDTL